MNLKIFLWKKRRFRLRWDSSPGLSIAEQSTGNRKIFFFFCSLSTPFIYLRFEILELVLKVSCSLIGRSIFKEEKKYHLRFQRLNSDGNFLERYDYNAPKYVKVIFQPVFLKTIIFGMVDMITKKKLVRLR